MLQKGKTIVKSRQIAVKNKRMSDETHFFDGLCMIYRTTNSGDIWQFRMYAVNEQRYIRLSLKTRDKEKAEKLARDYFIQYSARIAKGELLFTINTEQMREKYLEYVDERVESGIISKGRAENIKIFTRRCVEFVGANKKVGSIEGTDFMEYRAFRQKSKADITMTVVVNELISIRQMFNWAQKKGIVSRDFEMDWGDIKIKKHEVRREGYSVAEYKVLSKYAAKWYSKVGKLDDNKEEEIFYRKSIRDFIGIMANYGMRTGELLQLRWKDVKANSVTGLAEIKIRAETSKGGEDRENTGRRADIFLRRKVYSTWNNENDYVFSDFKQRRMMSKDRLYRYYKKLCDEIELEEKGWKKRDIYALRHFYISLHLLLGKVDAYTIARWAGTSLVQIQKHYDNVKDKQVSKKMNYDFNWDELASEFGFDERDDLKESKEYL